jgi:hypothetical protein
MSVRIPTNVDLEDRLLGQLTARQLVILAVPGSGLYLLWRATAHLVPIGVFVALALPVAGLAVALAVGRRDGVPLDRYLLAALTHHLHTRALPTTTGLAGLPGIRRPAATAAPLVRAVIDARIGGAGALADLGPDGVALLAVVSPVNLAMRTPAEQQGLVAIFAGYLHSLTGPVHILIRALPLDLSGHIRELRDAAHTMAHPALAAAATDHAEYLAQIAATHDLLRRQCLLILREPRPLPAPEIPGQPPALEPDTPSSRPASERVISARLARRLAEAGELLAPAGLTVTPLSAAHTLAVLGADPPHPNPYTNEPDHDTDHDQYEDEEYEGEGYYDEPTARDTTERAPHDDTSDGCGGGSEGLAATTGQGAAGCYPLALTRPRSARGTGHLPGGVSGVAR